MKTKVNNPILEKRLEKLMAKKNDLVKLKKSQRGNQLKETDNAIARIKKWMKDPSTQVEPPQTASLIYESIKSMETIPARKIISDQSHAENANKVFWDHFFDRKINSPGSDQKTPENDGKPHPLTDQWPDESPQAWQNRQMDIKTAFRKMNGFD